MRRAFVLSLLLSVAACGGGGGGASPSAEMAVAPAPMAMSDGAMAESIVVSGSRKSAGAPDNAGEPAAEARQLAYEYNAELRLPSETVGSTLASHERRCVEAGPAVCQVISSSVSENGPEYVTGYLEIRAARPFMDAFRGGLAAEAEGAKGSLVSMAARAEDLTYAITDTSARLAAQKALRERLIELLKRDTDQVGQLLEIERELARVQGEIDSAESYLTQLKGRVSMDRLTLSYTPIQKAVTPQATRPLLDALTGFFAVLAQSLASLILFLAAALPWILVGVPVIWVVSKFVRALWRKRKG